MPIIRLGLVSDTHMPARCATLPPAVFDVLRGVDLVLHAGDVGELWVLDQLSAIAPVIAVHGNDETADARRELPYQQVIVAGGQRILLTHAHYPDRAEEMESRKDDAWLPKLARRAAMGRAAGARVVVFGHTHIPMTYQYDDILLVNPGAIASPNPTTRQHVRTVAILTIHDDGTPSVTHIDLARSDVAFVPDVDWNAGFMAAHDCVTASILTPALAADYPRLVAVLRDLAPDAGPAAYLRAAHRCWSGEQDIITHTDLLAEIEHDPTITPEEKAEILAAQSPPPLSPLP